MYYLIKSSYHDDIYLGKDLKAVHSMTDALRFNTYLEAFNFYVYELQQSAYWVLLKVNN